MHELQDEELCRPDGCHAYLDDHTAFPDVEFGHRLTKPDMYKVSLLGGSPHEGSGFPLLGEKILDHGLDARPGILIIWLEDELFRCILYGSLHHREKSSDGDITPFVVIPCQCTRPPDDGRASAGEGADDIDGLAGYRVDVERLLFFVRNGELRFDGV